MKHLLSVVAFAGILALTHCAAGAITVTFDEPPDSAPSQVITPTVTFGTNEPVSQISITPGSETAIATFFVAGAHPFVPEFSPSALIEPGSDPGNPIVSDLVTVTSSAFGVDSTGAVFTVTFQSDAEATLPRPPGFGVSVETGQSQTIFGTFFATEGGVLPFVVNATSDLEVVPEPMTLLLLGAALTGLSVLRYRRGHFSK